MDNITEIEKEKKINRKIKRKNKEGKRGEKKQLLTKKTRQRSGADR